MTGLLNFGQESRNGPFPIATRLYEFVLCQVMLRV
jgi:hypothetical protein